MAQPSRASEGADQAAEASWPLGGKQSRRGEQPDGGREIREKTLQQAVWRGEDPNARLRMVADEIVDLLDKPTLRLVSRPDDEEQRSARRGDGLSEAVSLRRALYKRAARLIGDGTEPKPHRGRKSDVPHYSRDDRGHQPGKRTDDHLAEADCILPAGGVRREHDS